MIAALVAALVLTMPTPPRAAAAPPVAASGAIAEDALLSCEEDAEALSGTPFGRACPSTARATAELHAGWDDDDASSSGADDPEVEWDLAFGEDRDPAVDEGSPWGDE